jgi:hypothetical protein
MAVSKRLKDGESTIYQRLVRRGFPVIANYLASVITWDIYHDKEKLENEVARIEAAFPFTPEFADFATRERATASPALTPATATEGGESS